ncbi:uncharacterized protein FIBRA_00231 [Fibroporia radiculosa]|uniref:J domain-containing protein n=1 Tax=Fibroporia radiculosa TaxID=599839 RepID=J7RGN8_9APHY|nr:uncharacterized protein FIBRA_00231 [Fibroporia radiculosa]CCL98237.1 predicted protein [Fibroporia radiculosa]
MPEEEDVNPYELLGVTLESTEAEIRTAYRQRSLKVHPDRNRGNPDAARKFHELNQAYELLLDPLRRMALDAKVRVKEARKARFASYDNKRKGLVDELEARERAFKKARVEKEEKEKARWQENERIMEEGRRMREEREKELNRRETERLAGEKTPIAEDEPPTLGALDTTVRLKYSILSHPLLTTPSSLSSLLAPFGSVDEVAVVLSLKPAPPKKPKRGTALVPFRQIGGAFAAVCASGRADHGLGNIEISWAEGREPDLIGWLKKMGKLETPGEREGNRQLESDDLAGYASSPKSSPGQQATTPAISSFVPSYYSSFPSTFPDVPSLPVPSSSKNASGLDYESLTLMRLRQAERARLEREIKEHEAAEEA